MVAQSAIALAGFSAILVLVGLLVLSPSAAFLIMILAAVLAVVPVAVGARTTRVVAALLLIAATVLAVTFYPEFRTEQRRVTARAQKDLKR